MSRFPGRRNRAQPPGDESFGIRTRQVGDIESVTIFGDLDEVTVEALAHELRRPRDHARSWVVLDLVDLRHTDAAALAYLAELSSELQRKGIHATMVAPPSSVRHALRRAGVDEIVPASE